MNDMRAFFTRMRGELIAAALVVLLVIGGVIGVRFVDSYYHDKTTIVVLTAQVSEEGGWQPRTIYARVGQPLRLRITSNDVTHGFLLPDFDIEAGLISPGEFITVEFTLDRVGTFKFYCNVLCSICHGAMNGVIIVEEVDADSSREQLAKTFTMGGVSFPRTGYNGLWRH